MMSACGTKRTFQTKPRMSGIGGKADMAIALRNATLWIVDPTPPSNPAPPERYLSLSKRSPGCHRSPSSSERKIPVAINTASRPCNVSARFILSTGALVYPNNTDTEAERRDVQDAARATGQQLLIVDVTTEREIDGAFATFAQLVRF